MSHPNLIETLERLGDDMLNEIPDINYGGCGLYAAEVAEALTQWGVPVRGVVADTEFSDIEEAQANGTLPNAFEHVLIEFEHEGATYWHDAERTLEIRGVYPERFRPWIPFASGRLTVEELREHADNPHGWNWEFDREANIPEIGRIVGEHLMPPRKVA